MAALKNETVWKPLSPGSSARGRDNYTLLGVLRTKPGRADSPPTRSMSCSDKIALWTMLGIQGAIGSLHLDPIYITHIIIGGVSAVMQETVREDCERALWSRFNGKSTIYFYMACFLTKYPVIPIEHAQYRPAIHFSSVTFVHSKLNDEQKSHVECKILTLAIWEPKPDPQIALCWVADGERQSEIIINGFRRGVSPRQRTKLRFRYVRL
jgi:tRNA-specific adenosine deaminase 1